MIGQDGASPLVIAAENGHLACLELLLDRSANIDALREVKEGRVQEDEVRTRG